MGSKRWLAPCALPLAMALALPGLCEAQGRSNSAFGGSSLTGVGYTAVFPEALLGAGVLHFFSSGTWGVSGDWKMSSGDLRDHGAYREPPPDQTTLDPVMKTTDQWQVFNVAIMRVLSDEMAIMLGWGLAERVRIHEHIDTQREESYYTQNRKESGWMGNPMVGLLFRGGRSVAFRFGLERGPRRLSSGVYFLLP